jgi:hypothetical protein
METAVASCLCKGGLSEICDWQMIPGTAVKRPTIFEPIKFIAQVK